MEYIEGNENFRSWDFVKYFLVIGDIFLKIIGILLYLRVKEFIFL